MEFNWSRVSAWIKDRTLYFHPIPNKLEELEKFLYSILKIVLVLIILYYILTIFYWTFDQETNLYIEPFRTNGASQSIDGSVMAAMLQNQMQNIREMGRSGDRKSLELPTEPMRIVSLSGYKTNYNVMDIAIPLNLTPLEDVSVAGGQKDLEDSLAQLGSINIEGTSFSIGQLILSMKELRGNRPEPISCSIQNLGSIMSITGIYQDVQDTKRIFSWEVRNNSLKQNNATNEPIILLIEDLAFQITHSLGKSKSKTKEAYPQNWLTFKRLLQSREAYKTYLANGSFVCLNNSMDLLSSANLLEPHYEGSLRKTMLYNLGLAYLSEKEYTKSMELFENLSILEPKIGYYGLALAYYGDKDLEKALNYVNRVIVLDSEKNANAWMIKGLILASKADYANAIKSLDKATDQNSRLEWAWFLKGMISFEQVMDESITRGHELETLDSTNMNDAIFNFNKTIDIDPNNSWALFSKGRILRGEAPEEALELFNSAIALDPSNAFAWNERGNSLLIQERYEEALEAKDIALNIYPDKYNFWWDKGILLNKMKRYEEARECFERAYELGA